MAIKTLYSIPTLGANLELLNSMGNIKIQYDLKVVPFKGEIDPSSEWEAFAINDLDDAEDSFYDLNMFGTGVALLKGPRAISKHYGILSIKNDLDRCHYCVYRFTNKEKRDEIRKSFRVFDKDLKDVPNIDDYIATGTDEQGYYFIINRDKGVEETVVFTYTDDGQVLKNNVNPKSYSNIFDQ